MTNISEQEIDIRPYIQAIIDKWFWILGAGILAAIIGYGVSLLMTPTYEATALVAITEPRQRVQLDPRIQTVTENRPLQAYPDLAKSDELLSELLAQLPENSELTLRALKNKLTAEPGSDPTILKLTVSDESAAKSAELANTWAELFINWANRIYGDQGEEQLVFFEEQLKEAGKKLEEAEQAQINFQAHNRSYILENELLALQQTQADYLAKQRQANLILQDIESLLAQPGNNEPESVNQLASILLQIRALGGVANSTESTMPWQIQVNVDGRSNLNQADQQAILSHLRETLLAQSSQIEEKLVELEPQILLIQQEKQEANSEENRLLRDTTVAEETYTALARAVDEKRITSQDTTSGVKLASRTSVPSQPASPNKLLNAIAAMGLGLLIATTVVLIFEARSNVNSGTEKSNNSG